ncbi:alpha-amylase family protein [uncultured Paraglaciecola sp.]|uniref:alpha-amylase family protein n=1 Tax=uncultured Paraglaciecola sp. TaxID=1765024 RepID=UPI0030DAAEA7
MHAHIQKYNNRARILSLLFMTAGLLACSSQLQTQTEQHSKETNDKVKAPDVRNGKPVVYQVFTRLFGNTNTTNKPWGTINENGVGKFSDFTDTALIGIKELGVSHIWYTGVPHHDVITDYTEFGISQDDPDVVKGRAGSPYAVKDYYSVNPDLADNPANRLAEFEALIKRTHANEMRVIIDIVPNHVARNYQSLAKPDGLTDFGENDNTSVEYARDNNFYYVVGQDFKVPMGVDGYRPLGGDNHPLADGKFIESPAKWTGNGSRKAQPDANDWYETVKVNYGVKPDGSFDFETLPDSYRDKDISDHVAFWADKTVPDSWLKFRDITQYWLAKGVDGFRYDMAEMVPVEFWSYLNSQIKQTNPQAFLLAEVYNPDKYRDYIALGKMDYLYDKVGFYDSLKGVMQETSPTSVLIDAQASVMDIEQHMLHFLENHDEQRIASPEFAGTSEKGKPALVVSALISRSPTLIYFAQEVGEDGSENMGFGLPSRTTIFDYAGVPAYQRWTNQGKFDGAMLSSQERKLREYYRRVLVISASQIAMQGEYVDLHKVNIALNGDYDETLFAYSRFHPLQQMVVVSNFAQTPKRFELTVPLDVIEQWGVNDGRYQMTDLLTRKKIDFVVENQKGHISMGLGSLQSMVLSLAQ